jgi:hypothetical protein
MAVQEQVKIKVEADARQAQAEFERLKREVNGVGTAATKTATSFSDALGKMTVGFAKFNLALGGIQSAIGLVSSAVALMNEGLQTKQAERAFGSLGATMGRLQDATGGMVTEANLMMLALRNMQGDFHLTETGMETLLRASTNLSAKGLGSIEEIAERIGKAVKKGEFAELKELGIQVDTTKGKQTQLNEALHKLQELASEPLNIDPQLQQIGRLRTATQDWITEMKTGFATLLADSIDAMDRAGRWVEKNRPLALRNRLFGHDVDPEAGIDAITGGQLRPGSISQKQIQDMAWDVFYKRSQAEGKLPLTRTGAPNMWETVPREALDDPAFQAIVRQMRDDFIGVQQKVQTTAAGVAAQVGAYAQSSVLGVLAGRGGNGNGLTAGRLPGGNGGGGRGGAGGSYQLGHAQVLYEDSGDWRYSPMAALGGIGGSIGGGDVGGAMSDYWSRVTAAEGQQRARSDYEDDWQARSELGQQLGFGGAPAGVSLEQLEQLAGTMEKLRSSVEPAGIAMNMFQSALTASVDAAITGGDSIAKAAAKAAAGSLRATAIESSVKAMWETAQGIALLATGYGSAQAAVHFLAAAKYAATAIAAGAGAAALGHVGGGWAGASASGAGAGAGGGYTRPSGSSGGGATNYVIIVDKDYSGDPHGAARAVERGRQAAQRAGRLPGSPVVVRD